MLSANVASDRPPPPIPPRALNMPGHMKQTKDTKRSCTRGEAYQGSVKPKIRRWRYIHPAGRSGGRVSWSCEAGASCSTAGLDLFSVSMLSDC